MLLPLGLINSVSHAGRQAWFISTRRGRESVAVGCACSRHPPLSPDSANAKRINGVAMRDIKRPVPRPFRKTDIPCRILIDEKTLTSQTRDRRTHAEIDFPLSSYAAYLLPRIYDPL